MLTAAFVSALWSWAPLVWHFKQRTAQAVLYCTCSLVYNGKPLPMTRGGEKNLIIVFVMTGMNWNGCILYLMCSNSFLWRASMSGLTALTD